MTKNAEDSHSLKVNEHSIQAKEIIKTVYYMLFSLVTSRLVKLLK